MRTFAKLAALAVLFAPTLASAQLSLGARLGYGFAMGEVMEEGDLGDIVKAQIPLQLDVGYRVTPALTLGGYFAYGFGRIGDDIMGLGDVCDQDGVDCSSRVYRLGVQIDYAFKGPSMTPWVGAGFGYEWAKFKAEAGAEELEITFKGFEFLNLQGGVDWKVADKLSVGPFAMVSIGQYSTGAIDGDDEDIENKGLHQWLQLGVRGRFDL